MTESILRHVKVFESETDGYRAYRIPAIEMAADGTLLAFAEGRKHNLADPGGNGQTIDLVMKRSTDNGATWSDMRVIEAPGECWSAANPATLRDRDTGRITVEGWPSVRAQRYDDVRGELEPIGSLPGSATVRARDAQVWLLMGE